MSRIAVLGLGNWGTALALSWANDSHQVIGWTIEDEVYGTIMEKAENTKYLPGIELDIDVTMDIGEAIDASELLVLSAKNTHLKQTSTLLVIKVITLKL